MSAEDFECFKENYDLSKKKRASNRENSTKILKNHRVDFVEKNNGAHLIVQFEEGLIDFWPGTGKWIVRGTEKHRRGVFNLLKRIGK